MTTKTFGSCKMISCRHIRDTAMLVGLLLLSMYVACVFAEVLSAETPSNRIEHCHTDLDFFLDCETCKVATNSKDHALKSLRDGSGESKFDESCSKLDELKSCAATCKATNKDEIVASLKDAGASTVCKKEWKDGPLKCAVGSSSGENSMKATCGDKMDKFGDMTEKANKQAEKIKDDPTVVKTTEFKESMGDICGYAKELTACTAFVLRSNNCSFDARDMQANIAYSALRGLADQELESIAPECSELYETIVGLMEEISEDRRKADQVTNTTEPSNGVQVIAKASLTLVGLVLI